MADDSDACASASACGTQRSTRTFSGTGPSVEVVPVVSSTCTSRPSTASRSAR